MWLWGNQHSLHGHSAEKWETDRNAETKKPEQSVSCKFPCRLEATNHRGCFTLLRWCGALHLSTGAGGRGSEVLDASECVWRNLCTAEFKCPGGRQRRLRGGCFPSLWHELCMFTHARLWRLTLSCTNRLQEFCVYSENKKWARSVNIGRSDCRRTVAAMDFL